MSKEKDTEDYLLRFIFDKLPVRGAIVVLTEAWQKIASQKNYAGGVKQLLGELLGANVLLSSGIKFEGRLIVQIQGGQNLQLMVSECTNNLHIRATAAIAPSKGKADLSYSECLEGGRLVISIDANNDGRLYQSIVEVEGKNLAEALGEYMMQSEQLNTYFVIACLENRVIAFMLQQLPTESEFLIPEIERVFMLASTLKSSELSETWEFSRLLHNLFNEDDIVMFNEDRVEFACTCSDEKVISMIRILGKDEANSIIAKENEIRVTCDFCNAVYVYDQSMVDKIFSGLSIDSASISSEVH